MYEDYYKLKEKPFELTPLPKFLYLGDSHREALALLTYGVRERKGFILLTGEVGTGKTTMVQVLLTELDKKVKYIYISNPLLSPKEFIDYLTMLVFKRKVRLKSKADFLIEFEFYLKECLRNQWTFALIIDEAQALSFELLEEIRLLSNMEWAHEKLINIFLVGQPEINEKLRNPRCKALLQRINTRYHISPLNLEETKDYMETRLRVAGVKKINEIFSNNAIKAINKYTNGYPRAINILADNCLLLGYAKGKRKITTSIVQKAYEDMALDVAVQDTTPETHEPAAEDDKLFKKKEKKVRFWILAPALLLLIAGVSFTMYQKDRNLLGQLRSYIIPVQDQDTTVDATESKKDSIPISTPQENQVIENVVPQLELKDDVHLFKSVLVREGDSLSQLSNSIYGKFDYDVLNQILRYNPEINNINRIRSGQKYIFPLSSLPFEGVVYTIHIASFQPFEYAKDLLYEMAEKGYEGYIIPAFDTSKGKVYRVTLGTFKNYKESTDFANMILAEKISDYAAVIKLERD